jgi:hypothetical protein
MEIDQLLRLKEPKKENPCLNRLAADHTLNIAILKEVSGKTLSPTRRRVGLNLVLGQVVRRTRRYRPTVADDPRVFTENVVSVVTAFERYGYRPPGAVGIKPMIPAVS